VWAILVVNTVVQIGPIAFLSLAEKTNGQIDAILAPAIPGAYNDDEYVNYQSEGLFFNFT
jgi:hypothetical protein